VVTATGAATEVGRIGELVAAAGEVETPLEKRLDALGRRLAVAALGVAAVVAILALLKGDGLLLVLQTGIAVAVAAVPEGLPAVVTIAMAVGVWRMSRRNALVRRLPTVESLGAATVICTDKTGTLTAGEQTVTRLWVAGRELSVTGVGYAPAGALLEEGGAPSPEVLAVARRALRVAALANRAGVTETPAGWTARGDPTEAALLVAARKAGLEREALRREAPEVAELPFSSERMLMATYHAGADGRLVAAVKGAPARILERCTHVATLAGDRPLDAAMRERIEATNGRLAAQGLRVLALAEGVVDGPGEAELKGLVFLGLAGMMDPPAAGVPETIERLRGAGIRTVMLTGDQRLTAEAVARELGLLRPGDETLGGAEVDALPDDALRERAERIGVVSRVSAEAKVRLVRAFQRRGDVVAMLGDGINDAAALRTADVGVAMGGRGTDVAKAAAGIVLADDRFQTIAAAVEEGRVVYDNIRKFVFYLFSCNLGEIVVLLGAGLAGLPLPLYPLQILWMNLVTDTFPALALALEPAEPDIMRRPSRPPGSTILSGRMLKATVAYAALIGGSTLAAFLWGLRAYPGEPRRAVTLSFLTLALSQVFHLGNARSRRRITTVRRIVANRSALAAVALTVALQLVAVYLPPLAGVLRVEAPTAAGWLVVALASLAPAVVGQAVKG
ncbi:MAG: cation-transporting P-type ATPase, partial [Gemmatimonadetes bacterium]|nr:cation-transporting P-type ATPase [Gemmatimonadota bacterium]